MKKIFFVFFIGIVVAGLYAFFIEPNWIQTERIEIQSPRLAPSLQGLTVVHVTDLHLNHGIGDREKDLVKKVNELQADILLFSGDYFDDLTQLAPTIQLISQMNAKIGKWGVPGNTDHITMDGKVLKRELQPAGITILVNEAEKVSTPNGSFWIVGVDDPVYDHSELSEALKSVPAKEPKILLAHSPDIFDEAVQAHVDLVLVGHTHGGQVGIPLLIQFSEYANRTPYMKGLFEKDGTQMYVNRGIGMKTLPIRFLCRPEIAVIEVKA